MGRFLEELHIQGLQRQDAMRREQALLSWGLKVVGAHPGVLNQSAEY